MSIPGVTVTSPTILDGYKTHITAVIAILLGIATSLGWITPDDQNQLNDATTVLIERVSGLGISLGALISIFQRLATAKAERAAQKAMQAAVNAPENTAFILERK